MNLNDITRGGTFCLSKAGLGIGSTEKQVSIAAPNGAGVDYCIKGIMYHKADAATVAITAGDVQPVLTTALYVVCLNSAGTLSTVKGGEALSGGILHWPEIDEDLCPIGAIKVALADAATFTPGTTDLDASDVTATYYDFFAMPVAPLTAA